jgi:hypothetical protein
VKRVGILLIAAALFATSLDAQVYRTGLTRALANALYCQLSGCTMTGTLTVGRVVSPSAFTPTASVTGFGTSPTVTVTTGSSDFSTRITVTAGATPATSGTLVVTFSAASVYGPNGTNCVAMLANTSTGAWNARATVIGTAGGALNTSHSFTWDNNAVALTATNIYGFEIHCMGR